jgi:ABC-type bacteriocin/lantibiotic exporter with double-glycine peptidase domain
MELSVVNNDFSSSQSLPQISITDSDCGEVLNTSDNEPNIAVLEPSFSQTSSSLSPNDALNNIEFPNIDLGNAIEVKNVSFGYNKNTSVLTDITLNVPKGLFSFHFICAKI